MTTDIKELRREIWWLLINKIPALFEDAADEEEELNADQEVQLDVGKYAGATTWTLSNGGGNLTINVYPSGLVNVCLDEVCHREKQIVLCDDLHDKNTDTAQIVMDIGALVDIFLEGNLHLFMDVLCRNNLGWRDAVAKYNDYIQENPESNSITTYIF